MKVIPQKIYLKENIKLIKFAEIDSSVFYKLFQDKFADNYDDPYVFGSHELKIGSLVVLYDGGLGPEDNGFLSISFISNQSDLEKIIYLDYNGQIRIFGTKTCKKLDESFDFISLIHYKDLVFNLEDKDTELFLQTFNIFNIFFIEAFSWFVKSAGEFRRGGVIEKYFHFPNSQLKKIANIYQFKINEKQLMEDLYLCWEQNKEKEKEMGYEIMISPLGKIFKLDLRQISKLLTLREKYLNLIYDPQHATYSKIGEYLSHKFSLETGTLELSKIINFNESSIEYSIFTAKDFLRATSFIDLELLRIFSN